MIDRREFLAASMSGAALLAAARFPNSTVNAADSALSYRLTRDIPTKYYDGKRCWSHPRAGIVPDAGRDGMPRVLMTINSLDVSGSDVFKGVFGIRSDDLGKTWTPPTEIPTLAPRYETIAGEQRPVAVSDFSPRWHAASKTLLGSGHTVVYTKDWKVAHPRPRHTSYATYDPQTDAWSDWKKMQMPAGDTFHDAGAGSVQRYDEADGSLLLPIYFRPPGKNSRVTVARCSFDGTDLKFEEHGNVLAIDNKTRGLHEPSLTKFAGRYLLTIRNDERGFVSASEDGQNFSPLQPWKFDDGSDLGNYNTQQHWVTHSDAVFLVYTRRGADNDHVFRHRAPLFMAQVDPQKLHVIKETEQVLVPERGARLGNFGVTEISPNETWVTVAEWMQTWGPKHAMPVNNQYGSDGSIWAARIHWSKPNGLFG